MWDSIKYDLKKADILHHIVEKDLATWHHKYILEEYQAVPNGIESIKEIYLDPGGMMIIGSDPHIYKLDDGTNIKIKEEHIWAIVEYFFNRDLYLEAKNHKESKYKSGSNIRVIDDKIVKVYFGYYVLVLKTETYLSICDAIEVDYISSANTYLKILTDLIEPSGVEDLIDYASLFKPAEA